jgi:hypothetical protein
MWVGGPRIPPSLWFQSLGLGGTESAYGAHWAVLGRPWAWWGVGPPCVSTMQRFCAVIFAPVYLALHLLLGLARTAWTLNSKYLEHIP